MMVSTRITLGALLTGLALWLPLGADSRSQFTPIDPDQSCSSAQIADPCSRTNPTDQCTTYKVKTTGNAEVHWTAAMAAAGVHYSIVSGTNANHATFLAASFDAWEIESNGKLRFVRDLDSACDPSNNNDNINCVGFGALAALDTNAREYKDGTVTTVAPSYDVLAGVTTGSTLTRYGATSGEMREADITLNSALTWAETLPPPSNQYWVPNTAVHEVGHFIGLADLCKTPTEDPGCGERKLTMFFQGGGVGITEYATLGEGDRRGLRHLYP